MHNGAAVFFDRDGVVNRRIVGGYVRSAAEFDLLAGFTDVLELVQARGYRAIIITNQQGVGKGLMDLADLERVHRHLQGLAQAHAAQVFDGLYSCTTLAADAANARKPSPHMLALAQRRWNLDIGRSWMIGDSSTDILAGRAAGASTIGIHMYESAEVIETARPDYVTGDLAGLLEVLKANL